MLYLCVLQQLVRCGVSCMNSASVDCIEVVLGSIRVQGGGKGRGKREEKCCGKYTWASRIDSSTLGFPS